MSLPRIFSSRALPWTLLALALALNAFFIGGHIYSKAQAERATSGPAERSEALAERLGLDERQSVALKEMWTTFRARGRELRAEARPHVVKLWDELAKASPDEAVIDAEVAALAEQRRGFEREAVAKARSFMAILNPEQRKAFAEFSRDRFIRGPLSGKHRDRPKRD